MKSSKTLGAALVLGGACILGGAFLTRFAAPEAQQPDGLTPRSPAPGVEAPSLPGAETKVVLSEALRSPQTPDEVRELLVATRAAGDADRGELRRAALESSDPMVVGNALRALGRLDAVVGDVELLGLAADARPRVRQEFVRALGASGDDRALELLADFLSSVDPTERVLAVQALGGLEGSGARALLGGVLESSASSELERAFASQALAGPATRRAVVKSADIPAGNRRAQAPGS